MPNSHGYANAMSIIAICSGTAIIYPSEAFEPQLMFSALVEEQVTHVSLVPTMVTALCAIKEATGDDLAHLKSIMVGGAVVSPLVIKQSLENLGAEAFENAYGMTDGVFLTLGAQSNPDAYIDGEEVAVGKALPGCGIKICAREDVSTPLPRNQTGELHYTGILNCDGYVGMGLTDDWYVDNKGIRWFKTGDQARMDEQVSLLASQNYG
jgi:fatty-acyl-CoA synthase